MKIALNQNGKFLCAEQGGNDQGVVNINRDAIGPWETLTVHILGGGFVALETVNGRFLSQDPQGHWLANRTRKSDPQTQHSELKTVPDDIVSLPRDAWEAFAWADLNRDFSIAIVEGAMQPVGPGGRESGPLHLGPRYFLDDTGQPWPFIGYHLHTIQIPAMRGEDIGPSLDVAIQNGFNTVIIIGVHLSDWEVQHGLRLDPHDGGYYDHLASVFDTLAAKKIRGLFYCFGPGSEKLGDRQQHFHKSCEVLRGRWNALIGKGNESNVNGWQEDEFSFPDMGGVLVSQGTAGGNVDPTPPYLDFVVYETRRDMWSMVYDNGSGMLQMQNGDFPGPAVGERPLISGEWGMVNEVSPDEVGDQRFTDPLLCLQIGRANGAFCAGGAIGSSASLESRIPGPIATECCRQYARGVRAAFVR